MFAETFSGDAALWLVLWVFAVGAVTSIVYEMVAIFTGLPTISTILRAAIDHFAVTRAAAARADAKRPKPVYDVTVTPPNLDELVALMEEWKRKQ